MLIIRSFLVLAALAVAAPPVAAETFTGRVRVIDGDSLAVGDRRVRLYGIDAPEAGQTCAGADGRDWPCGNWATRQLSALAAARRAVCEVIDTDRYGRGVARCRIGGQDLGSALVRAGAATAYRRYSDAYVPDETEARRAARGLWQGTMLPPEAHRAATRAQSP
ncbi:MAG: nuclease, partial [Alphaproteobacteria bacterium HGW-Alphaproteobacteria-2]